MNNHEKQLVKAILTSPTRLKWSAQGLGMLRTYLSPEVRLHIWDSSLKVYGASPLHTHPWHLHSRIVAGELRQIRYTPDDKHGQPYKKQRILCGPGTCVQSPVEEVKLAASLWERYLEGMEYTQTADEIHESLPVDGTVTLVTRTFLADANHADVYWQGGGDFVSAEPRHATPEEVQFVTQSALNRWFQPTN